MRTIAVILARAGSQGLPDKCVLALLGEPVIGYTIGHALTARGVADVVLTTDSKRAAALGIEAGILVLQRPAELAADTARVDAAVRHAVEWYEARAGERTDGVVILYGNVPVRAEGIVDRCVALLEETGCSSVRTVAPVTKQHPDWIHRLDGDRMVQFRPNSIHRRQDLEPLYYHDGAVVAVTRESLFAATASSDPHAFFGSDRRAILQEAADTVDIDTIIDLYQAEAVLRYQRESGGIPVCDRNTKGALCIYP
jgi:CMP-N,N'-diacetyllegionaminic acid synthase